MKNKLMNKNRMLDNNKHGNNLAMGRNLVDNNNTNNDNKNIGTKFCCKRVSKFQLGGDDVPNYFLSQRLIIGTFSHHDMTKYSFLTIFNSKS